MIMYTKEAIVRSLDKQKSSINDFYNLLLTLCKIILSCDEINSSSLCKFIYKNNGVGGSTQYKSISHDLCEKVKENEVVTGLPLAGLKILANIVFTTIQNLDQEALDQSEFNVNNLFGGLAKEKEKECHVFDLKYYFNNFNHLSNVEDVNLIKDCLSKLFQFEDERHILILKDENMINDCLFKAGSLLKGCMMADGVTIKLLLLIINLIFLSLWNCRYEDILNSLEINKKTLNRLIYIIFGRDKYCDEQCEDLYNEIKDIEFADNMEKCKYLIRRVIGFVYEPWICGKEKSIIVLENRLFSITKKLYSLGKEYKNNYGTEEFDETLPETYYIKRALYHLFHITEAKPEFETIIGSDYENYYSLFFKSMEFIEDIKGDKLGGN